MQPEGNDTADALALIARCLAGDVAASRRFQEIYGELVYGYPLRVYRVPPEDAGDFYVFAFDSGRIFRRLRTFEGRAPLRAYLLGFVLDDLVLEWKRGERTIETVSLDDVAEPATPATTPSAFAAPAAETDPLSAALAHVDTAKAVVFKLLHAEDCELTDAEIRHIASVSGKGVAAVLEAVDELRSGIREREAVARSVEENLDSVQAWIQLYERRVARIDGDLRELPSRSRQAERLSVEKAELERKLRNRRRQRGKLVEQVRRRKVTAPYKEIASVLNTTVGNVGSQVARLRAELGKRFAEGWFGGRDSQREERRDEPIFHSAP